MNYIVTANTDIGISKNTNQDSVSLKVMNTPQGRMALAVLCDGMGGLAKGEVASASVLRAFDRWARTSLPRLCRAPLQDGVIRAEWDAIVQEQNRLISSYGTRSGIRLGTTVVAMLITQNRYYILNVGDSRAYELSRELRVLTQDQTVVAREVAQGLLTEAQAQTDPRRSVLLQCVGASDAVAPDFFFGTPLTGAVYMLCSDGFRHEITPAEILEGLRPERLTNEQAMRSAAAALIELNKQRWERDNITVALVRTY